MKTPTKFRMQLVKEACLKCKPFIKYGTTRLILDGERICSVCGDHY